MTDKATTTTKELVRKIERYGLCKFSQGACEVIKDTECAARDKAEAKGIMAEITAEVERLAAQAAPTETAAVVSVSKFTRLKFFRDLSNDERMKVLRVFMDLSTIPDDAIQTHGIQRQLFDKVFAAAQPSQAPVVQAVQVGEYPPEPNNLKTLSGPIWPLICDWAEAEMGPDAGRIADKIDAAILDAMRAYVDADRASSGATTQAVRMLTEEEVAKELQSAVISRATWEVVNDLFKAFGEVNAGRTIPPSGKIGGAA